LEKSILESKVWLEILPTKSNVELDLGFPFNLPLITSFRPFIEFFLLELTVNKIKQVFKKRQKLIVILFC